MFDNLTPEELAALSKTFQRARLACRKVMHVNWASAPVTDTYRRMLVEFRACDPLFTESQWLTELSNPTAE